MNNLPCLFLDVILLEDTVMLLALVTNRLIGKQQTKVQMDSVFLSFSCA